MADLKITQLTEDTTPAGADLLTSVKSPFGAGSNKKVTMQNLFDNFIIPQQAAFNIVWASQTTWYIDPIGGNDSGSGLVGAPLKTWAELRRRMKLVGGHSTDGTAIQILSSLASNDTLYLDWGCVGTVYIRGTTSVVRSGSLTSVPQARNNATNLPNVITDSAVSSWASDVGISSGRYLLMTSGTASGAVSWVVKNLGSHQARMSTFIDINTGIETFPSNGDTYNIISMPFIQEYHIIPSGGFFKFTSLDLGNNSSSDFIINPFPGTQGVQFNYCGIYNINLSNATAYFFNNALKTNPSIFNGTIIQYAGVTGDISSNPSSGEVETAGEWYLAFGALSQGVRANVINLGYVRYVDAMIFDSPDNGVVLGTGGRIRITSLAGSGNTLHGVSLVSSAAGADVVLAGCTVTGTTADVDFCGVNYSWAQVTAVNGIKGSLSNAYILPSLTDIGNRVVAKSSAVTAANDLTLGNNQNIVAGNTQINAITTANWPAGSQVTLIFSGTPTVKHNTAGGAGTAKLFLAGSVDFVAAANSILGLTYDGTQWQETFRKVA